MTPKQIYNRTRVQFGSRANFISAVAQLMGVAESTVRGWTAGRPCAKDTADLLVIRLRESGYVVND